MFSNPYYDQSFGKTIILFFSRMAALLTGQLPFSELASDDIQILVLIGVAASSALVGTFLVLRRMTMLANSLSHTILIGIVLAYLISTHNGTGDGAHSYLPPMQAMFVASIIMGLLTAFFTEFLTKTGRLQEDASAGIVFTSLFAAGVILLTLLTKNAHIGTEVIMGNVDALHKDDIAWVFGILVVNCFLIMLFFKAYKITTFDSALASALGFCVPFYNYLLMAQVSATSIGAFRAVGVLLVLSFMTGPVLTARLLTHHLGKLLLLSVAIGSLASLVAVALSRHILTNYGIALSTSGVVVCVIACFYLVAILFAPTTGLIAQNRHKKAELR